jgi:hypothetical protein
MVDRQADLERLTDGLLWCSAATEWVEGTGIRLDLKSDAEENLSIGG